jgi:hypothetical protein
MPLGDMRRLLSVGILLIHCSPALRVITREIEPAVDHNHCTTRQFQHMTFHHEGVWFVFYSDGRDFRYRTSDDRGRTWRRWLEDIDPGFKIGYSNLIRDSTGHIWVITRESGQGTAYRSREPDELRAWSPAMPCLPIPGRHALDAAALDGGKLYVASVLTTSGKMYGNLFDGRSWGHKPVLIADGLTTVAGDDRRLALEFDRKRRRLHLIYVDAGGTLRYRSLDAPWREGDWQPRLSRPGSELADRVFTGALSVEPSGSLIVTYGLERYVDEDRRVRTGELYARRLQNGRWASDPVLVSQPGTIHNWYPNVNQDASAGLCVLYSRSVNPVELGKPLAVMTSVVTLP